MLFEYATDEKLSLREEINYFWFLEEDPQVDQEEEGAIEADEDLTIEALLFMWCFVGNTWNWIEHSLNHHLEPEQNLAEIKDVRGLRVIPPKR